ncbi:MULTISPECIES: cytochrome-c peroxidase [unclassified Myroides]|uniref:cytochrome-c peroxidase n=1 Tax=unclassified Myroides TaxID=2642485 RepID=UPI003D2F52C8
MKNTYKTIRITILLAILGMVSCSSDEAYTPIEANPLIDLNIPADFPALNPAFYSNQPTKFGVELGEKLFFDPRLSRDNTVACASCHIPSAAYADHETQGIGIEGKEGLRNVPPIQNLAFMQFYNWDGSKRQLEKQVIVPIITPEEMHSSMLEVIRKIKSDQDYQVLFKKAFGDGIITSERIYQSIAQYEYTLISAASKYDQVKQNKAEFTAQEREGHALFQVHCATCHSGELFTDQTFRNIGFPINRDSNEAGRARVTGDLNDYMSFRVPSLRNIEFTAPYGSFGQFKTLREVLDYMDQGVINSANLDPIFKENQNRLPLTEEEKEALVAFMLTLSDYNFIKE